MSLTAKYPEGFCLQKHATVEKICESQTPATYLQVRRDAILFHLCSILFNSPYQQKEHPVTMGIVEVAGVEAAGKRSIIRTR